MATRIHRPVARFFAGSALLLTLGLAPCAPARAQEKKPSRAALNLLQEAFVSIAEEIEPAVVTVTARKTVRAGRGAQAPEGDDDTPGAPPFGRGRSPRTFRSEGTGSGVILSADGWILTNDHVVAGADKVTIRLHDGREFDGVVRRDMRSDLALVKITASDLHPARLGDSEKVKIGQWAIAVGSPFRYEGSFSVGVISSLFRKQEIPGVGGGRLYPSMIQTDAAINPGNSGGPLVNIDGEVVGINTAIESDTGGSVGIGFAIPINSAKFVIDQLKSSGRVVYGYLGVDPDTITPRLASVYRVSSGALVQGEPAADSPAAKAGIQAGDVITEIDGKPVHNELDLRTVVSHTAPGRSVNIVFLRDGAEKRVKATIAEPPNAVAPEKPAAPGKASLGIEVSPITADAARRAGLGDQNEGVVVKTVDAGGSAGDADLRAGDVILAINDKPVANVEAFNKATAGLKSGDTVKILRVGNRFTRSDRRVIHITID